VFISLASQLQVTVAKFVSHFPDDARPAGDLAHIDECRTVIVDKKHQLYESRLNMHAALIRAFVDCLLVRS
jgi:hypothetical protein